LFLHAADSTLTESLLKSNAKGNQLTFYCFHLIYDSQFDVDMSQRISSVASVRLTACSCFCWAVKRALFGTALNVTCTYRLWSSVGHLYFYTSAKLISVSLFIRILTIVNACGRRRRRSLAHCFTNLGPRTGRPARRSSWWQPN